MAQRSEVLKIEYDKNRTGSYVDISEQFYGIDGVDFDVPFNDRSSPGGGLIGHQITGHNDGQASLTVDDLPQTRPLFFDAIAENGSLRVTVTRGADTRIWTMPVVSTRTINEESDGARRFSVSMEIMDDITIT